MNEVEFRVPDQLEEILGWRAWQVVGPEQTPRLASVTALSSAKRRDEVVDAIWPTARWFYARCPHGHVEGVPVESCGCGLYAANSLEQLIALGYGQYGGIENKVVGQVGFAGKVIEGDQGWRAEKGRIVRLWIPFERWAALGDRLAAAYDVPCEPAQWLNGKLTTLEDLAARFAPPEGR